VTLPHSLLMTRNSHINQINLEKKKDLDRLFYIKSFRWFIFKIFLKKIKSSHANTRAVILVWMKVAASYCSCTQPPGPAPGKKKVTTSCVRAIRRQISHDAPPEKKATAGLGFMWGRASGWTWIWWRNNGTGGCHL
jgi:hypothetical protein